MGITIAHGNPQIIWVPVQDAATIYVGGLVRVNTSAPTEGVTMLPDPEGAANVTNKDVPYGICIGTNRATPLFDTTYNTEYITAPAAADPHDGASIEYTGVEGPYGKGDPIAMVQVALIDPCTVLRAPIYNAAVSTAPTEVTVTTGSTTGLGCTTGAIDFTADGNPLATMYLRAGANRGTYRILDSNSATVHTWDTATKADIAVGDKAVAVPLRTHGLSTIMFDGTSASFIDCADAPDLDGLARWIVHVVRLDLSESGKEYAEFRFDAIHFAAYSTAAAA